MSEHDRAGAKVPRVAPDLVIAGGRVIDPAQQLDEIADVAIAGGIIVGVGGNSARKNASSVLNAEGKLVLPGLIDLHTHVYWAGTPLGVAADPIAARSGVTTFVDAGSAGAGNFAGFYEHVMRRSSARILAFLNICYTGIVSASEWIPRHERTPLHHMSIPAALEVAKEYSDRIVGFKVLAAGQYTDHPLSALRLAVEAGKAASKPVMVHFDLPPAGVSDILPELRSGDILTHAFRGGLNTCLGSDGGAIPELLDARNRGVLLDIGHGAGSFSHDVARAMVRNGIEPDCISSDIHIKSVRGTAKDLPTTMSKMLALGMDLSSVVAASTINPARALGLERDLGHLRVGSRADVAIFELEEGQFRFEDAVRISYGSPDGVATSGFCGRYRFKHVQTVLGGRVLTPPEEA